MARRAPLHQRPSPSRSTSTSTTTTTTTTTTDEPQGQSSKIIHLDGRTLEGGGQLVRNALALSALTGHPITITHIRGNRQGKTGLKGSHAAAVQFLTEMCEAEVRGEQIGSTELTFVPRRRGQSSSKAKSEYDITLSTAGSIFLVFQAVYPYLLLQLQQQVGHPVRLRITGGTNVSCAPSYDYVEQVLVPNLRRVGLPDLAVRLHGRGWSTGPIDLGAVTFEVHPLETSAAVKDAKNTRFPRLNLSQYRRGSVARIDITILAPDTELRDQEAQATNRRDRRANAQRRGTTGRHIRYDDDGMGFASDMTIRDYLEKKTQQAVSRVVRHLPETVVPRTPTLDCADLDRSYGDHSIPIQLRTSEATQHHTHLYILLVAHTSNGFRIGTDALFDGFKDRDRRSEKPGRHLDRDSKLLFTLDQLVERCVTRFVEELEGRGYAEDGRHRPCVDVHMRDQLVIFDALGRHGNDQEVDGKQAADVDDDERYWSLHTQTAQWVCEQILGEGIWGTSQMD